METLNKTCLKMSGFISKVVFFVLSSFSASFLWTVGFCTQLPLFLRKRRCDWVRKCKNMAEGILTYIMKTVKSWGTKDPQHSFHLSSSLNVLMELQQRLVHTSALHQWHYEGFTLHVISVSSVWPAHITTRSQQLSSCSGSSSLHLRLVLIGQ